MSDYYYEIGRKRGPDLVIHDILQACTEAKNLTGVMRWSNLAHHQCKESLSLCLKKNWITRTGKLYKTTQSGHKMRKDIKRLQEELFGVTR